MEEVEELDTDRANSISCQKNQKAVALNILITVDKPKGYSNDPSYRATKKCKHKVKVKGAKDACCGAGASIKNSYNDAGKQPYCIPNYPNSEMLPCGCLIVYDQASTNCNQAGAPCDRARSSKQNKCSRGRSSGTHCQGTNFGCQACGQDHNCVRVKVRKKICCNKTTAGCQTVATNFMKTSEQIEPDTQDRSIQAFQSQRSIAPSIHASRLPPPSSKCSRISAKPSLQQAPPSISGSTQYVTSNVSVKASQYSMVPASSKSTMVIVPPSSVKPSQMKTVPSDAPKFVSTKATQHSIIAPSKNESHVIQTVSSQLPKEQSDAASARNLEAYPPQWSSQNIQEMQMNIVAAPPSQIQRYYSEAPLAQIAADPSYVEEISDCPPGDEDDDDECNECEEEICEEDGCFTFNFLSWKKWDLKKWDQFISLLNGEPTCAPNLCEETSCCDACEEEEQNEECNEVDGWTNAWNGGCGLPYEVDGGSLCMQDPIGQDTYVLLIALPLVFLGLFSSFKTTC